MSVQGIDAIVRQHPFCKGMPDDYVTLLSGCALNRKYAPSERLFRHGEEANCAFLIRAGRVAFELHDGGRSVPLETAEEGELVGWSWLFPPYKWHFDAVAVGSVRALEFDGECLRNKCETDPAFGFDLSKRILMQAQKRLERSRLQLMDVYSR